MPEIIGSAYVRIRAVTTQLAGDIKDGIDKGAGDAKVDAAGKKVGTDFSDGMSKGVDEQAPDFHKHVNESVSGSGKDVDKHGNFLGRRLAKGMGDGVDEGDRGPNGPTGRFKKIFDGFDKFANSFNLPPIAWTALFALGALGPVVQIAGSYIAGLVAQLGFVVTAAAGAGAALAGLIGIAAIAAVPIVLAFKVDTPQLESFKQFAKDIGKSWQEVGKATQKTLLPGLTVALKMSAALIPAFRLFGSAIGGVVGDAAKMTAGFLSSQRNAGFLHDVMSASVDIVKKLTSAFALLIDSVLPFFSAAAPVAKVLADQILKIADHFDKFIRSTSQSGQLTATLDLWYGRFTLIMRILANVGRMLGTVFRIGADAAQPMFEALDKTVQRWTDFTKTVEGQNRIKAVFDAAIPVMHEVNLILKDIIGFILKPLLTGDNSGIIAFLQVIRKDLLPALFSLSDSLSGSLINNMIKFVSSFAELIKIASDAGVLQAFFGTLTLALDILKQILGIPGVAQFAAALLTIASAFSAVMIVIRPMLSVLGPVANGLFKLAKLSGVLEFFGEAAAGAETLGGALTALIAPALPAIAVVLGIAAAIAAVVFAVTHWDTVGPILDKAIKAIGRFFQALPAMIADALGAATDWVNEIGHKITDGLSHLLDGAGGALSGIGPKIGGFFEKAIPALTDWIVKAAKTVGPALAHFLVTLGTHIATWYFKIQAFTAKLALSLVKWIIDAIPTAAKAIGGFIVAVGDFLAGLPEKILEAVGDAANALIGWITGDDKKTNGALEGWFGTVVTWLADLPGKIINLLSGVAKSLWGWITDAEPQTAKNLQHWAESIGPFLLSLPGKILGWLGGAIVAILSWLVDIIPATLIKLGEWALQIGVFLVTLPAKIIVWLAEAAIALISWLADAGKDGTPRLVAWAESIGSFLIKLPLKIIGWLAGAGVAILGWIGDAIAAAPHLLGEFIGTILGLLVKLPAVIGRGIASAAKALWGWIEDAVPGALGALGRFIASVGGFLVSLPGKILGFMATAAVALVGWIGDAITVLPGLLGEFLGFLIGWSVKLPVLLVGLFVQAVAAITGWVIEAIPGLLANLGSFFASIAGAVLGFVVALPGYFVDAVTALWNWITTAIPQALAAIGNFEIFIAKAVLNFVTHIPGWFVDAISSLWNWIVKAVPQALTAIAGFITSITGAITGFITDLPSKFLEGITAIADVGKRIVEGIWDGIVKAKDWLIGKVKDFAGGVIKGFLGAFGINSPAKTMIPVGTGITEGIALGITTAVPMVTDAMGGIVKAVQIDPKTLESSVNFSTANLKVPQITTPVHAAVAQTLSVSNDLNTNFSKVGDKIVGAINGLNDSLGSTTINTTPAFGSFMDPRLTPAKVAGANFTTQPMSVTGLQAPPVGTAGQPPVYVLVKIGERELMDIVDARIDDGTAVATQALYRRITK